MTPQMCEVLKAAYERGDYVSPQSLCGKHSRRPHYFHCDDPTCTDYYVLCWGESQKPHLRYKPSLTPCKHGGGGPMTLIHRLSCQRIADHHQANGTISAYKKCPQCHDITTTILDTANCEVILEATYPRWDVAFIRDGITTAAIESAHTHLTDNLDSRNNSGVPWCEFRSTDIITATNECKSHIEVEDIRQDNIVPCMSEACQQARGFGQCTQCHGVFKQSALDRHHSKCVQCAVGEVKMDFIQTTECLGDGTCFQQVLVQANTYVATPCIHQCVLHPCASCGEECPERILNAHNGQCLDCTDEVPAVKAVKTVKTVKKRRYRHKNHKHVIGPTWVFPIGKHKGETLNSVMTTDGPYIKWILRHPRLTSVLRQVQTYLKNS